MGSYSCERTCARMLVELSASIKLMQVGGNVTNEIITLQLDSNFNVSSATVVSSSSCSKR